MSSSQNPYQSFGDSSLAYGPSAAVASEDARAGFIRLTYLHLAGAVLAFAAICGIGLQLPIVETFSIKIFQNPMSYLFLMFGMMGVSWLCSSWASNGASKGLQYAGLSLYTVAQAIFFMPFLYVATKFGGADIVPTAGIITLFIFAGLTATVFITGADFSFLKGGLAICMFGAIGLVAASWIFGFTLGLFFAFAMIVLASGYILYETSNILHHYPVGFHVAAALALFASLTMLFWYVLRILMALRGD